MRSCFRFDQRFSRHFHNKIKVQVHVRPPVAPHPSPDWGGKAWAGNAVEYACNNPAVEGVVQAVGVDEGADISLELAHSRTVHLHERQVKGERL